MKISYISTNAIWSGSEVLWFVSANAFLEKGYSISIAVKYQNEKIDSLKKKVDFLFNLNNRFTCLTPIKLFINKYLNLFKTKDLLLNRLQEWNPDLVVISQGNNIDSIGIMELCISHNFRFITITQLVTEFHMLSINGEKQKSLNRAYEKAIKNYFVSKANLQLHEFMLAYGGKNNEVISNPIMLSDEEWESKYPLTVNSSVAFVGRIECFHKGLDILIKLLSLDKWKGRAIEFNLYGTGPHTYTIEQQLAFLEIKNVYLKGFESDIREVWRNNQILILPSRMEGQSLALLEALYCNRTAIVTNVGGAADIIDDNENGFIAKTPSLEDLDDALERAWVRRKDWEVMGIAAGEKIRRLNIRKAVNDFQKKIIEDLNCN